MIRSTVVLVGIALASLPTPGSAERLAVPFTPRFEAVAETRLLMEGMLNSNYRSLEKLLKTKPADRETWVFARGQALLVAEGGNLLLLRPPKGTGRDTWMKLSMEMRSRAVDLAFAAAAKDHAKSVKALADLKVSCVRCHQTFRVGVKLDPERAPAETDLD